MMGNIGIKINGQWVDLMSAFVPCQLCNEPVQIRNLVDLSQDAVNGTVSWQCLKCSTVNGQQRAIVNFLSAGAIYWWTDNGFSEWS